MAGSNVQVSLTVVSTSTWHGHAFLCAQVFTLNVKMVLCSVGCENGFHAVSF